LPKLFFMSIDSKVKEVKKCPVQYVLAIQEAMNAIQGKWKVHIIASLLFGPKRFSEIQKSVGRINPRMLSKELKELELNGIIKREIQNISPVVIEYSLTESGCKLKKVLDTMIDWGIEHRVISLKKLKHSK